MSAQRLGLTGLLAQYFVSSKLTPIFIITVALMGIMAVLQTPREENPQIVVPAAAVIVDMPGASAAEVESLIVTPLEGILSELSGVDHIESTSHNSRGIVQVQFKVGESKEQSLIKLYDRVIASSTWLPAGATPPLVQSIDADDVPIVTFTLASSTYDTYALNRMAERIAERLRSTENVSVVSVYGGQQREITIELDPDRLQAYGVTLDQVRAAIATSNLNVPFGPTVKKDQLQGVKLVAAYTSVEDVGNQLIAVHDSRPIYLNDVASLTDGPPSDPVTTSRFSFGLADFRYGTADATDLPAVTIAVAKKKDTNAVRVANAVIQRVQRMQNTFVPQDIQVIVTRNDGQKADDAVNLLLEHLIIALVTVGIVLIVFLGWREALIVVVTVPLIISITLVINNLIGITINRVTLFALILALGLLVDAAIVVIENIHRHYSIGSHTIDKKTVAVLATNEISGATNLATFAVMLVFGTMVIALTGMMQQYLYPVAVAVPVTMAASVLVAYIVVPWAANRWIQHNNTQQGNKQPTSTQPIDGKQGRAERTYLHLFSSLQQYRIVRIVFSLAVAVLMLASIMQGAWQFVRPAGVGGAVSTFGVPIGFLPKDNQNTFNVVLSMPENTPVEITDRLVREIVTVLEVEPNIVNWQTSVGQAGVPDFNGLFKGTATRKGSHIAEIRVNLVDKRMRKENSIDIVRELRTKLDSIHTDWPDAEIALVEQPPGPPLRSTVLAELYGPTSTGLRELSAQVREEFTQTYDTVDITDSEPEDILEYRIIPDNDKATRSGVSSAQIAKALELVYGGTTLGRAHLPNEKLPVPIKALVPRRFEVEPARLDRVFVDNTNGDPLPLAELVNVVTGVADRPIQHRDNERVTFVGAELSNSVPLYAVLDLQRRLQNITAPDGRPLRTGNLRFKEDVPDTINGYQLLWGGEMRMTLDVYRGLSVSLSGALLFIYLMLVAYYRSFMIPLIAMSAVPLGLIGIFPGHWLMNIDFSATSMVGIIALAGVVIRNSLLIIDFIQANIRSGMLIDEAVCQAGAVRLRPILLTMLAIIFGSAVMVTDPVFSGLAVSLIFGTLASTVLTVFVVPLLYELYEQHQKPTPTQGY